MKFLVVEDDDDLRELLRMFIVANYNIEIIEAFDGQDAIEKLRSSWPFNLIICDYNMPRKNGAEVFGELRAQNKTTPFILISTEVDKFKKIFPNDQYAYTLEKPFVEADLIKKIENVLALQLSPQSESYQSVSIDMLEKIVYPGVSLFIRLNQGQYIKVLNENAHFDSFEAARFKDKNLTHLYAELIDIKTLIASFRKNIFSKIDWDSIDTNEAIDSLQTDWNLILESSKKFGWSDSVATLAKENIAKTLALIKKSPKLKSILDRLSLSNKDSQMAPHCYFLAILASAIAKELYGDSHSTLQKIVFAALLHDMALTDEMYADKINLITEIEKGAELSLHANFIIFNHPIKAAESVSSWTSCPPDVDKLILQHHERFDGKGYPHRLNFQSILPLAGVMIMAEDIIYQMFINKDINSVAYIKSRESYYSQGEFKKVYAATLKVLEECAV